MELAPVWAAIVGVHDRLDLPEVRLVHEPVVDVHRDVPGLAAKSRAERDVVGRDRANLTRRVLAKMRSLRSVISLRDIVRAVIAARPGIHVRRTWAARWIIPNVWFSSRMSLT